MTDKRRPMGAEKENYPVKMMARALKASRSGSCSWLARGEPDDPRAGLREAVRRVWLESDRIFGARFVLAFLPDGFASTAPRRVRERMGELGIRGIAPNSRKRTTIPDEGAPARPDLVRRGFAGPAPACKPVGDITYLRTREGWLYLAVATGLCTRMAVGWAVSGRMTADIAAGAPGRAWRRGRVASNAASHSDRGSQRASGPLARWADEHGVRLSVGRTGGCRDDAVAESFSGTPKDEMRSLRKWATREEARNAVIGYIERRHDRNRPHPAIGYRVPAEAMDAFFERTRPAAEGTAAKPARAERMAA